jgi:hypothetical protein
MLSLGLTAEWSHHQEGARRASHFRILRKLLVRDLRMLFSFTALADWGK